MPDAVADQDQKPWDLYSSKKPWELYGSPQPESIDQEDALLSPPPDAPATTAPLSGFAPTGGMGFVPPPSQFATPSPAPNPFALPSISDADSELGRNYNDFTHDLGKVQGLLEKGGAAVLNEPAEFYRAVTGSTPKATVSGVDDQGRPTIGQADKSLPFQAGKAPELQGTLENPGGTHLQKTLMGFLTPGNIISFPFAESKPVQAFFLSQTAPGAVEAAKKLVDPSTPPSERGDAATDLLINAVMSHGLAHGLAKGGESDASSISTPAEVHGDMRTQPVSGQGQVPAQEGGGGVQSQGTEAPQAQVPLKPKGQDQFGYKYTKDADGNWYQDGVGKKVTDERLLNKLEEDHEQLRPKDDWQVSVQAPMDLGGGKVAPGNVQLVDPSDAGHTGTGGNKVVATVDSVRAAGHNVPDFSQLPQGKYTYAEALKKLKESPGTGLPKEDTKNGSAAEARTPTQSGVHLLHDEETGQWHVVNGKDEVVPSHATMDEAAKAAASAEGKEPEPEPFLEPTDQKAFDYEIKKLKTPIRYTDRNDEGNPFHSDTVATIDRKTGQVVINKRLLKWHLDNIPRSQRHQAIKSVLDEEVTHLHTKDSHALAYWKTLHPWEQAIVKRIYSGGREVSGMDDTLWGHEALRMQRQRLTRMKLSEVASAVGREKWTLAGLQVIEASIRSTRRILGRRISRIQDAILKRTQRNIDEAKAILKGSAPRMGAHLPEPPEPDRSFQEAMADAFKRSSRGPEEGTPDFERLNADAISQGWTPEDDDNFENALFNFATQDASEWPMSSKNKAALLDYFDKSKGTKHDRMRLVDLNLDVVGGLIEKTHNSLKEIEEVWKPFIKDPKTIVGGGIHEDINSEKQSLENELESLLGWQNGARITKAKLQNKPAPRALFRGRPKIVPTPKEQQDFILPDVESRRVPGTTEAVSTKFGEEGRELSKTSEEERKATEEAVAKHVPKPPSANEIEAVSRVEIGKEFAQRAKIAGEGKNVRLPNIKDFSKAMRSHWRFQPGHLSELWSGAVGKFIANAPGETLRLLGKSAFGSNVREILSDKELNERFKGNPKAAVEYAKRQERSLAREAKRKGGSIWDAPVVDAGFGTEAADRIAIAHAQDKYPGVGIDALDLHWADQRAQAEFERRNKLFSKGKIEAAPSLEKLKVAELQEVAEGKRLASKKYQLERSLAKSRELRSIQSSKRRRAWISSAIFLKMVKQDVADSEGILNRKSVTPDDVRPSNDGKYSSYEDVSDFPKSRLGEALVDKARRSSKDSATITRRLALVENKRTGEVSLVSAYDRPHGPDVDHDPYLVDPTSPTRTHIPLAEFAGKYNILRSVFLDQPVRKFVQHFKDYDEYRDKLGKQLEMDVANAAGHSPEAISEAEFAQEAGGRISEGSGGSFQGPHRDLVAEPESGAAEKAEVTPITPHEERSVVDYVNQFGRPRNPEDVMRALEEMAVKKPNAAVVSALRKIGAGFQKHFPDYDEAAVMKALSRAIYDKTIPTGRALPEAESAKAAGAGKNVGTSAQAAGEQAGDQAEPAVRSTTRPKDVISSAAAEIKSQIGGEPMFRKPSPGESPKSPRALFRRQLNDKRDETMEKLGVVKNQVRNLFKRLPTGKHMAATLDGARTIGNNMGAHAEMSIRLESADNDKNSLGYAKNFRGKKEILEAAPAVLASGAVKTLYHYDTAALAEKSRLLREDEHFVSRAHSLKSMLGRSSTEEIKSAQQRVGTDLQNKLIETGFLKHDNARYLIDHSAKAMLDKFMADVKLGTEQAKTMAARGNVWNKYRGRKWIKSNKKIMRTLEYAKAQWDHPELMATARRAKMEADRQFDIERDNGYSLHYDPEYLPGRYEGSVWSPNGIIFGGQKIMGRQYYAGKTFKNIYEAAKVGPYIPASLDIASLMGSRVRTGMNSVSQRMWWDSLKELKDENGNFVVKEGKPGGGAPSPDYVEFPLKGTMQKVYVHQSYEGLIHQLTDPDVTMHNAASKLLQETTQFLKHTALLGDFFHLGRVMYYSQSIMGFKGARFKPGWAATVIREGELDRAVDRGIISPQTRDYLKEKIAFRIGPKADMISRARLSELYERSGLNTGRIQDALYQDLVKNVPILGAYNRFLFDRFTTGMMKTGALREFDRLSKLDPEKDSRQIVQESAKDLNLYFGSIGRQGWIKSATFRSIANIGALAPQWLEGLVKKEVQPVKLLTDPYRSITGRNTAFRGIARGLGAMMVLTQVTNMITRGTPTWNNPEPDHKWDAWIPGNIWLSPLAVFNELTADIVRISETKPRFWDAVQQVGMNKLSFVGRFAMVLASGSSPTGEYQSTTGGVLKTAAAQLIPLPISVGTWAQFGAHFLAPGTIPPVPLAQLGQKFLSTMGVKTHVGLDPVQTMNIAAQAFRQANGVEEPKIAFTDEATNSKLRYQLKNGDEGGAARTLQQLRQHHTDGEIIQSMETWARRPFTSHVQEGMFQSGMDDYGRKVYNQAIQQRYDQVNQFLEWYDKQARKAQ